MDFVLGMLLGICVGLLGGFGALCACAFWIGKNNDEKRDAK